MRDRVSGWSSSNSKSLLFDRSYNNAIDMERARLLFMPGADRQIDSLVSRSNGAREMRDATRDISVVVPARARLFKVTSGVTYDVVRNRVSTLVARFSKRVSSKTLIPRDKGTSGQGQRDFCFRM